MHVSTLLEILAVPTWTIESGPRQTPFQPFLRFWLSYQVNHYIAVYVWRVSTLLEILGLVCLVVVGF